MRVRMRDRLKRKRKNGTVPEDCGRLKNETHPVLR